MAILITCTGCGIHQSNTDQLEGKSFGAPNPRRRSLLARLELPSWQRYRGFGAQIPSLAIALLVLSIGLCSGAEDPGNWHSQARCRWKELPVSPGGKTGFTELPPEKTGIYFTNVLEESAGAANRILENGSGVAIGDFDGDGRPDIFLCSLQGRN